MATKLSIAVRKEEATRRLERSIEKMAQRCGASLPVGATATKDASENQAIHLETLAAQIEALADSAQPANKPESTEMAWTVVAGEPELVVKSKSAGMPPEWGIPADALAPSVPPEWATPATEPEPVKPKARK